jgi:hypothetical protein
VKNLDEIDAILSDIERLDAMTGGQFRQAEDREAFDIAARIERKMRQRVKSAKISETV